jgi:hypothetical protein
MKNLFPTEEELYTVINSENGVTIGFPSNMDSISFQSDREKHLFVCGVKWCEQQAIIKHEQRAAINHNDTYKK